MQTHTKNRHLQRLLEITAQRGGDVDFKQLGNFLLVDLKHYSCHTIVSSIFCHSDPSLWNRIKNYLIILLWRLWLLVSWFKREIMTFLCGGGRF